MSVNPQPSGDGDVNTYENQESRKTPYWNRQRSVIFINGMKNSAGDHKKSAVALSKLQMCKVVGVFNESAGTWKDLLQCLGDKWQFDGNGLDKSWNKVRTTYLQTFGNAGEAENAIKGALSRNKAAVAAFTEIRATKGNLHIFAHSQGNLILSNALTAISILEGEQGLKRFTVHSFGSPTVNWPEGFTHHRHGFTFDPVNWLAGFDSSFSISKVGVPSVAEKFGVISHGFHCYVKDDATFVVNRFRWGSFGMTASMDEAGLAEALANMGTNIPRITAISERLYKAHNSDVDDVAVLHVQKIKNNRAILNLIRRDNKLKNLLIKSLDEGWTSGSEHKAIALLKG
jgi:hypothetical protein